MQSKEMKIGQLVMFDQDFTQARYTVLARTPYRNVWWLQPANEAAERNTVEHKRNGVDGPGLNAPTSQMNEWEARRVAVVQGFDASTPDKLNLIAHPLAAAQSLYAGTHEEDN